MRTEDTSSKEKSVTFEPQNVNELSHFFEDNKDKYHEIWVVLTKKKYASPQSVSFSEALKEAIGHGLIDSRTKHLNDQKYCVRFTKRKPRSRWSEGNLRILEEIKKEKEQKNVKTQT